MKIDNARLMAEVFVIQHLIEKPSWGLIALAAEQQRSLGRTAWNSFFHLEAS